ncbi:hypothetical protein T265_05016 [Opisthorchis viverrini]|uniref:Uncharacterized protein n=1 Tax=Opisthorchis viverrini TaxID=6198 RepID=A0A074ZL81_OPIVI|nr:hypothetical protein T265_05016 [Opisthorchis viverrini]KER28108.1 hypothetical protein T265_05016 [Opisthorchis viverrini]
MRTTLIVKTQLHKSVRPGRTPALANVHSNYSQDALPRCLPCRNLLDNSSRQLVFRLRGCDVPSTRSAKNNAILTVLNARLYTIPTHPANRSTKLSVKSMLVKMVACAHSK